MITEITYSNRDNTVDLSLTSDGVTQDLSAVTRMVLTITPYSGGVVTVDSAVSPTAFNWATGTTGKVILALGAVTGLISGRARLVVYDATHANGVVWDEFLLIVG